MLTIGLCVFLQSVGSGLSLEPLATTEADEEEDGMSDIIQEVTDAVNIMNNLKEGFLQQLLSGNLLCSPSGHWTDLESGFEGPGGQEALAEFQACPGQCCPVTRGV